MPCDYTPAQLDFCNWGEIRPSSLSVCLKKKSREGKIRERDREYWNRTPFILLVCLMLSLSTPYDSTPTRFDFCNWGNIKAFISVCLTQKIEEGGGRGQGREIDREDDNKAPLFVLATDTY